MNLKSWKLFSILILVFISLIIPQRSWAAETTRLAGYSRYETATQITQAFWTSSDTIIIAYGENFPDALSGAALSYKNNHAPILLVQETTLKESILNEIKRLGATKAILLGETDVVKPQIEDALKSLGVTNITRYGGPTRYETAARIATAVGPSQARTAFIATGENFPDALVAAPVSATYGWPVILVGGEGADSESHLCPEARQALSSLGINRVFLVGDYLVVPESTEKWLNNQGITTVRLGGETRYDTALNFVNYAQSSLGMNPDNIFVATGENYPDALTSGPAGGKNGSLLIITKRTLVPQGFQNWLKNNSSKIKKIYVTGGYRALSYLVKTVVSRIVEKGEFPRFHATFISVGDGDAILLEIPNGTAYYNVLIDAGLYDYHNKVASIIRDKGIQKIDSLVLTHPHRDHVGSMSYLMDYFTMGEFLYNGESFSALPEEYDDYWYRACIATVDYLKIPKKVVKRNDVLSWGEAEAYVLHPPSTGFPGSSINERSLVIKLVWDNQSMLLTGDACQAAENNILASGLDVKAPVLKAGHHGDGGATSWNFLDKIRPELAIVSSADHGGKFPHTSFIERLDEFGVEMLTTGTEGDLTIDY